MKKKSSDSTLPLQMKTDQVLAAHLRRALELLERHPIDALNIIVPLQDKYSDHPLMWVVLARVYEQLGKFVEAAETVEKALVLNPLLSEALYVKANGLYKKERFEEAQLFLENIVPKLKKTESRPLRTLLATVLQKLKKYEKAIEAYTLLTDEDPDNWQNWNNLGMIYQDLAQFDKMDRSYSQASKLSGKNPSPHFNHIVGLHYHPEATPERILALCQQWQTRFKPSHKVNRQQSAIKIANKKLRIGMISEGFRSHPVGNMITLGLSHIPEEQMEIYAYSTNFHEDHITHRIQRIAKKWQVIEGLSDNAVNDLIRDDQIDILFDLCGYNSNSRMLTFQQQPAPIQIKWVGGLISSTGLEGMDYLLSDHVETPEGTDSLYTEKLIRLPGDYICYDPPHYLPPVSEGPVNKNGYITFGCFNNAAKVNDQLLAQWAALMQCVPESRLFLKSFNFKNELLCERVRSTLAQHGITSDRIMLEGSSPHKELLESYNRVDIALDPWPYSGGLTTCEAMAMGVPVVTLPGPTFAGRHSASHLVHAGMPELVADSWEQYIDIAVGLTNDLNSLGVIRQHLRDILLSSPVCDGKQFAGHFSDAMRAVWQRYCEGKAPEALSLSEESAPFFLDDRQPVMLQHPSQQDVAQQQVKVKDFEFKLSGKVLMMDYGGCLARSSKFINLTSMEAIHAVIMDPLAAVEDKHFPLRKKDIQHIKAHLLSDGEEHPFYMCLDARYSSDLPALAPAAANDAWVAQRVLTEVKFPSSKLDEIHGLDRLEWFSVDNSFNLKQTFAQGQRVLQSCLFINVQYRFENTHMGQLSFSDLTATLGELGFQFHAFAQVEYAAPVIINDELTLPSSAMVAAQLLFMPNENRLRALSFEQREKLAFILHAGYQMRDAAYKVLQVSSPERAEAYIANELDETTVPTTTAAQLKNIIPEMPRMSAAETELFERYVKQSTRYYEFGSGGSTKLATRNGIEVFGVESDKFWVDTLHKEAGPLCNVDYVDIGPTKEWGYPVDNSHQDKFPLYSEAINQHAQGFDFILVDGRFRVACTLNAIKHSLATQIDAQNTLIFIHDFWSRSDYHAVLEFLETVEKAEDAGVFKIKSGIDPVYMERMLQRYKYIPA
ncbi:hypothetical protein ACFQW4_07900 [Pantoea sp. GCM10028869]|uniref:O-linked N-acetylglucosamine transferase, SPINDLY family protein n=1 Tax=Pantoea sp. GCM10028869 TaxID=3273417 RepID=UPI00361CFBA3